MRTPFPLSSVSLGGGDQWPWLLLLFGLPPLLLLGGLLFYLLRKRAAAPSAAEKAAANLAQLRQMRDDGLISREEFKKLAQQQVDSF